MCWLYRRNSLSEFIYIQNVSNDAFSLAKARDSAIQQPQSVRIYLEKIIVFLFCLDLPFSPSHRQAKSLSRISTYINCILSFIYLHEPRLEAKIEFIFGHKLECINWYPQPSVSINCWKHSNSENFKTNSMKVYKKLVEWRERLHSQLSEVIIRKLFPHLHCIEIAVQSISAARVRHFSITFRLDRNKK